MDKQIRVLGIGGSLRKGSYSMTVLKAAMELLPNGVKMSIADVSKIPPFNQDDEASMPTSVKKFKNEVKAADAILFVSPEYNFGMPGYLKNAVDWASRPHGDNSFDEKPVALVGSSNGRLGGIKAQLQWRQIMVYLNAHVLNDAMLVPEVDKKVDSDGKLTDQRTRERLGELLKELVEWAARIRK